VRLYIEGAADAVLDGRQTAAAMAGRRDDAAAPEPAAEQPAG
jgi:hypothetical protein